MGMKTYHLLTLSLIFVVFFSGCTLLPGVQVPAAKAGAVSAGLTVEATSIPKNTPVGVIITVDNKALTPISNVKASVFGPVDWTGFGDKTVTAIRDGDSREFLWTLRSPGVGADTQYKIYGTVDYTVVVSKSATIALVTYDYYKASKSKSSITPSPTDLGGPIKIDYATFGRDIFVYSTEPSTTFTIKILISNIGGGKAYKPGGTPVLGQGLNQLNVQVSASSGLSLVCDPIGTVDLTKDGTSASISCDATVPSANVNKIAEYTVTTVVSYNYQHSLVSPTITVTTK